MEKSIPEELAENKKTMIEAGLDYEKIVAFRRNIHENAEGGFKEYKTRETIRSHLLEFGIEPENIKEIATTGLIADICGTGPEVPIDESFINTIALRTELDALPMKEENPHLPY